MPSILASSILISGDAEASKRLEASVTGNVVSLAANANKPSARHVIARLINIFHLASQMPPMT